MSGRKTLVVVTGPTASGKTDLAIDIALELGTEIISADSRQIYRGLPVGTAQPTPGQLALVPHHFVACIGVEEPFSAARFEAEALAVADSLWQKNLYAVVCGGSMLYIDALTKGLDDLPTVSPEVRASVVRLFEEGGLDALHSRLRQIDPVYLERADPSNHRRLIHAIEIFEQCGIPYSSLVTGQVADRPFDIVKLAIDYPREELFSRINRRVDIMMEQGLLEEARAMLPHRHANALNTVGYKELFAYFDGAMDLPTAVARIGKNTRVYAKKQMLWLRKNPDIHLLDPHKSLKEASLRFIND